MRKLKFKEEEKEYVEIHERILEFNKTYPGYEIITNEDVFSLEGKVYAKVQAAIINPNGRTIRTGLSMKEKDSNEINKFSFLENAETSAIGRALSFLGISATNVIASKDEIEDVKESINKSEKTEAISKGKALTSKAKSGTKAVTLDFITDKRTPQAMKKMYEGLKSVGLSSVILLPVYNRFDKEGKYKGLEDFLKTCPTEELKKFFTEEVLKK